MRPPTIRRRIPPGEGARRRTSGHPRVGRPVRGRVRREDARSTRSRRPSGSRPRTIARARRSWPGSSTEKVIYEKDAESGVAPFAAYREWAEASEVAKWERLGQKVLLREFEERGHVVRVSDHGGRVTFYGARLRLSMESCECGVLGTSDGKRDVGDELEKSGNSSRTATNATSNSRLSTDPAGDDAPVDVVDLTATALSIFSDVLVASPTCTCWWWHPWSRIAGRSGQACGHRPGQRRTLCGRAVLADHFSWPETQPRCPRCAAALGQLPFGGSAA